MEIITTGIIARPSRPSVRLTALLEPTITKIAKGKNTHPRSNLTLFVKGMSKSVAIGSTEP